MHIHAIRSLAMAGPVHACVRTGKQGGKGVPCHAAHARAAAPRSTEHVDRMPTRGMGQQLGAPDSRGGWPRGAAIFIRSSMAGRISNGRIWPYFKNGRIWPACSHGFGIRPLRSWVMPKDNVFHTVAKTSKGEEWVQYHRVFLSVLNLGTQRRILFLSGDAERYCCILWPKLPRVKNGYNITVSFCQS